MKKYFLYFLGLNLIAFAVVLNVRFDLGVAAFSSVMYSISQIYNISLGCSIPMSSIRVGAMSARQPPSLKV